MEKESMKMVEKSPWTSHALDCARKMQEASDRRRRGWWEEEAAVREEKREGAGG